MKKHFPFLKGYRPIQGAEGGFLLDDPKGLPFDMEGYSGVYIIETTDNFKFPYPAGKSKVIYIGKADELRSRLSQHRHRLNRLNNSKGEWGMAEEEPWVGSKYQYMYFHGAKVYYYKCRGQQEAKEEESRIMWAFYQKYRALPVGNGAKSYSKL